MAGSVGGAERASAVARTRTPRSTSPPQPPGHHSSLTRLGEANFSVVPGRRYNLQVDVSAAGAINVFVDGVLTVVTLDAYLPIRTG